MGDGRIRTGDVVEEAKLGLLLGEGRDPITGEALGRAHPKYPSRCMLIGMQDTTMRVSRVNRDQVKAIADEQGVTIDQALSLLLRRFRQQEMGEALAAWSLDEDDRTVLDAGAATVAHR